MSQLVYAATGHRPDKLGGEYDMDGPVSTGLFNETRRFLIERRPDRIITGMALGFDMIWAMVGVDLDIPITAAIPFAGQECKWRDNQQCFYHEILRCKLVTVHIVCDGGYAPWKMQIRNEWMVDNCQLLFAAWDGTRGGTANCLKYAMRKKRIIHRIDPRKYLEV